MYRERSPAFFCSQLPNHAGPCVYTPSPPELTYSSCYSVQCLGTVGPAKTREQTSISAWQHIGMATLLWCLQHHYQWYYWHDDSNVYVLRAFLTHMQAVWGVVVSQAAWILWKPKTYSLVWDYSLAYDLTPSWCLMQITLCINYCVKQNKNLLH